MIGRARLLAFGLERQPPYLLISLLVALAGCGIEAESRNQEDAGAPEDAWLALAEGAQRIQVGGGRDVEQVLPPSVEIVVGELVEFVTTDRRVHTLTFLVDSLSPEARQFLVDTHQLQLPPLLERGSRLLVDFSDAPPGRYVFSSQGHGDPAYGAVTVRTVLPDR